MKTTKLMLVLAVIATAPVALAGWFEQCVDTTGPGYIENTCSQDPESGDCSGSCYQSVVINFLECQAAWNLLCDGYSYNNTYIYNGSCSGGDCGCILDTEPDDSEIGINPC